MMSDDVQVILGSSLPQRTNVKGKSNEKGKSSSGINSYFMPRTTPGAQPTLKSVLQSKEARERCDLAISKWMIDVCLPFNVVTSPYYQPMIDAIASMGAGYKGLGVWNLHDIGKLDEVNQVVVQAAKITKFIYNHCFALHLMRKYTGGREILRPAPTRFATNFIALQSILAQKDPLRAMVTSREWTSSAYARGNKAKNFVDYVLNTGFWKDCANIVKLTEPIIRLLRIVDSEDKPTLGFLFAAFHKAKNEMIKRFQRKKKVVEPHLKILDNRWDNQLLKNIHAVGYWFNPSYQYDTNEMAKHKSCSSGVLDVFERYAHNNQELDDQLTKEMMMFKNAEGDFGRRFAINTHHTIMPSNINPY
ncbi:uncharacterized protein G2W53_032569 [Senna tora]|uniref:Uncharacterized protein n=1 Tax=Senna tora TaxID=362788 RepID=A0A834W7S9_9FABA|nr:uncharacterized protein G2W53_032569 [Senna tora]